MSTNYLEMSGTGSVSAAPDHAVLRLALEHRAEDVSTAMAGSANAVTAVLARLGELEIDRTDVQTASVRVEESWNHQLGRPEGYLASQGLSVRVRDVAAASDILGACVAAGADALRIHELRWGVADPAALETTAREAAWAAALEKATAVAALASRSLGPVLRVTESGGFGGAPRMMKMVSADAVPVEPGEQDVTCTLTVRWKLA